MIASDLHAVLSAVAPIEGVSVGSWDDKSTWRTAFSAGATEPQKSAAAAVIAAYAPFAPTRRDVKAEAQRRIVALVGMSDLQSCIIRQLNMLMRATELANKRAMGVVLTPAETTEASALQATADAIKAIRTRSNAIEALTPIPNDYTADVRWA